MRTGNRCSAIFTALVVCAMAASVLAGSFEGQLANMLISEVGEEQAIKLMELPRVRASAFLLCAPDLRFVAKCEYYADGDSLKVDFIYDYRGKR